jgi:hypothetical protein
MYGLRGAKGRSRKVQHSTYSAYLADFQQMGVDEELERLTLELYEAMPGPSPNSNANLNQAES